VRHDGQSRLHATVLVGKPERDTTNAASPSHPTTTLPDEMSLHLQILLIKLTAIEIPVSSTNKDQGSTGGGGGNEGTARIDDGTEHHGGLRQGEKAIETWRAVVELETLLKKPTALKICTSNLRHRHQASLEDA
jgi:hypothetical protein